MLTKHILFISALVSVLSLSVNADETHGGGIYYAFELEAGIGSTNDGEDITDWDFHGWVGTDENKLWMKSEGEHFDNEIEQAEFWIMYSRNIGTFWDAQIGLRYDTQPDSLSYAVIGFAGLAPYFFETDVHLFISEDGDFSARIHQEIELLITQRMIIQPYLEANLFAYDIPERNIGSGLSHAELGIQIHYELTRQFAPYIDIKYERKFGETASLAKNHGEEKDYVVGTIGIKLLF